MLLCASDGAIVWRMKTNTSEITPSVALLNDFSDAMRDCKHISRVYGIFDGLTMCPMCARKLESEIAFARVRSDAGCVSL